MGRIGPTPFFFLAFAGFLVGGARGAAEGPGARRWALLACAFLLALARTPGFVLAMTPAVLYRAAGAAALGGGLARIAVSFPLIEDRVTLEWLYAAIDVLLLFGVMGIYLSRAARLGFLGFASFAVAVAALSFIGGPDADAFGFSTYEQGAACLAIAMVGLSIAWMRAGERPFIGPLCWFASVIAAGVLGLLPAPLPSYGLAAAGALFGAGFALSGWSLIQREGSARSAEGAPA